MRPAFLDQKPPPGYVAGIGRGASGFTTGADSLGLSFSTNPQEIPTEDDAEDATYLAIEKRLQGNTASAIEDKTPEQFGDLKKDLKQVSVAEWASLPEAQDFTRRNKRQRLLEKSQQRFYALPDSIILSSLLEKGRQVASTVDFDSMSSARDQVLELKLDGLLAKVDTQTVTLDQVEETHLAPANDLPRLRAQLASLRRTDPNLARSWIMLAELELEHDQASEARRLIMLGTRRLPKNSELWLAAIRIHKNSPNLSSVINSALDWAYNNPQVWIEASLLESDPVDRKTVLMKGLERIPNNVILWESLLNVIPNHSRVNFATKAMELCPKHWPFWQMVIEESDEKSAKSLLNKARKQFTDNEVLAQVWIQAMKIENDEKKLGKLATKALAVNTDWISLAKQQETKKNLEICRAITAAWVETHENEEIDVSEYPEMAKVVFNHKRELLSIDQWLQELKAEREKKSDRLWEIYPAAISQFPEIVLVLMYAKDRWKLANDADGAREILKGYDDDARVWGARIKIEVEEKCYQNACDLSRQSLRLNTPQVWYKHVHMLRLLIAINKTDTTHDQVMALIDDGLREFPECLQLWLQKVQILMATDIDGAKRVAEDRLKSLPTSLAPLWLLLGSILQTLGNEMMARSRIDQGLRHFPKDAEMWIAAIKAAANKSDARHLITRALQACGTNGEIWKLYLDGVEKKARKQALVDALAACSNSSDILVVVGLGFWKEGKHEKAEAWWKRAVDADAKNGDALAVYSASKQVAVGEIERGRHWIKVSKDPNNYFMSNEEKLEIVKRVLIEEK